MDRYHVLHIIGEGCYGKVYKGRRKYTGEVVALKFIPKRNKNEKELTALRSEIGILRKLSHENIIALVDSFETSVDFCVVTEFAHGELFQIFQDDKQMPEDEIKRIGYQLVQALYYLHQNRIIHRDVKPQNVLVGRHNSIKLCDFGFARSMSHQTIALTSIKGTPLYMAPELVQEQPYNHTVDLWSLGVILYELFCGHPPFFTNSLYSLIHLIVKDTVKYPPNMSPTFKDFLKGLLVKDPSRRLDWPDLLHHPFINTNTSSKVCRPVSASSHTPRSGTITPPKQVLDQSNIVNKQQQQGKTATNHHRLENSILCDLNALNYVCGPLLESLVNVVLGNTNILKGNNSNFSNTNNNCRQRFVEFLFEILNLSLRFANSMTEHMNGSSMGTFLNLECSSTTNVNVFLSILTHPQYLTKFIKTEDDDDVILSFKQENNCPFFLPPANVIIRFIVTKLYAPNYNHDPTILSDTRLFFSKILKTDKSIWLTQLLCQLSGVLLSHPLLTNSSDGSDFIYNALIDACSDMVRLYGVYMRILLSSSNNTTANQMIPSTTTANIVASTDEKIGQFIEPIHVFFSILIRKVFVLEISSKTQSSFTAPYLYPKVSDKFLLNCLKAVGILFTLISSVENSHVYIHKYILRFTPDSLWKYFESFLLADDKNSVLSKLICQTLTGLLYPTNSDIFSLLGNNEYPLNIDFNLICEIRQSIFNRGFHINSFFNKVEFICMESVSTPPLKNTSSLSFVVTILKLLTTKMCLIILSRKGHLKEMVNDVKILFNKIAISDLIIYHKTFTSVSDLELVIGSLNSNSDIVYRMLFILSLWLSQQVRMDENRQELQETIIEETSFIHYICIEGDAINITISSCLLVYYSVILLYCKSCEPFIHFIQLLSAYQVDGGLSVLRSDLLKRLNSTSFKTPVCFNILDGIVYYIDESQDDKLLDCFISYLSSTPIDIILNSLSYLSLPIFIQILSIYNEFNVLLLNAMNAYFNISDQIIYSDDFQNICNIFINCISKAKEVVNEQLISMLIDRMVLLLSKCHDEELAKAEELISFFLSKTPHHLLFLSARKIVCFTSNFYKLNEPLLESVIDLYSNFVKNKEFYDFLHQECANFWSVSQDIFRSVSNIMPMSIISKLCCLIGNLCRFGDYFYSDILRFRIIDEFINICIYLQNKQDYPIDDIRSVWKFATFSIGNAAFHSDLLYRDLSHSLPLLNYFIDYKNIDIVDDKTRANAAGAIGNFVRNSDAMINDILNSGIIETMVSMIDYHYRLYISDGIELPSSIRISFFSLGNLSVHTSTRQRLKELDINEICDLLSDDISEDLILIKYIDRLQSKMSV